MIKPVKTVLTFITKFFMTWLCLAPLIYFWMAVIAFFFVEETRLIEFLQTSSASQIHQGIRLDLTVALWASLLATGIYLAISICTVINQKPDTPQRKPFLATSDSMQALSKIKPDAADDK